jgi:hypothetical protein
MNAAASIHMPNRIAAGVTAEYLRELTRRPAPAPGGGRHGAAREHRVGAGRFGRQRNECGQTLAVRAAGVS